MSIKKNIGLMFGILLTTGLSCYTLKSNSLEEYNPFKWEQAREKQEILNLVHKKKAYYKSASDSSMVLMIKDIESGFPYIERGFAFNFYKDHGGFADSLDVIGGSFTFYRDNDLDGIAESWGRGEPHISGEYNSGFGSVVREYSLPLGKYNLEKIKKEWNKSLEESVEKRYYPLLKSKK